MLQAGTRSDKTDLLKKLQIIAWILLQQSHFNMFSCLINQHTANSSSGQCWCTWLQQILQLLAPVSACLIIYYLPILCWMFFFLAIWCCTWANITLFISICVFCHTWQTQKWKINSCLHSWELLPKDLQHGCRATSPENFVPLPQHTSSLQSSSAQSRALAGK